jgi:hypothetical protein
MALMMVLRIAILDLAALRSNASSAQLITMLDEARTEQEAQCIPPMLKVAVFIAVFLTVRTTVMPGRGVQTFQIAGQFKLEAVGEPSHEIKYGYVVLGLKK